MKFKVGDKVVGNSTIYPHRVGKRGEVKRTDCEFGFWVVWEGEIEENFAEESEVELVEEYKTWKDMTPEEKGALLLAHHEGKEIQFNSLEDGAGWWNDHDFNPKEYSTFIYRVKPEPKEPEVTEVVLYGLPYDGDWVFDEHEVVDETHKITFNLVDGEPDCGSIKMEKL